MNFENDFWYFYLLDYPFHIKNFSKEIVDVFQFLTP